MIQLIWLLFAGTASAGPLDGFYEVTMMTDPHGPRTAEQLMTSECWSREVWAFADDKLSRGHQQVCPAGKNQDACEAWVTVPVSYDSGLVVPYTAEASSEAQTVRLESTTVDGDTSENRIRRADRCRVRLDMGAYQITLQELEGTRTLVLADGRRGVSWNLVPATPEAAPFKGVRK